MISQGQGIMGSNAFSANSGIINNLFVNKEQSMKSEKCMICEEGADSKDHFLYFCGPCNFYTPYCFSCNKSVDVLLNSNFFKCFSCKRLAVITNRQTCYLPVPSFNPSNQLNRLFQNTEDAKLLSFNIMGNTTSSSTRFNGGIFGQNINKFISMNTNINNSNIWSPPIQGGFKNAILNNNQSFPNNDSNFPMNENGKIQSIPNFRVTSEINDLSSVNYYCKSSKKSKREREIEELEKEYHFLNEKREERGKFKWVEGVDPKSFSSSYHSTYNSNSSFNKISLNSTRNVNGSTASGNNNNIISLSNCSNYNNNFVNKNDKPINLRQMRSGVLSVRQDNLNRPFLDNGTRSSDFSILGSKRDLIKPATSVKKRFVYEKENTLIGKRTSSSVIKCKF